jgi:hypothetical protein
VGGRAESRRPGQHGVADGGGHAVGVGGQRLGDEERVARGTLVEQVGIDGGIARERRDRVTREPAQFQPAHGPGAGQLTEQRPQRMGPVHLLVAIGDGEQQWQRAHTPADEPHDVERRLVGPVQVLQNQDGRALGLELGQQRRSDIMGLGTAIQLRLQVAVGGARDVQQRPQWARGEQWVTRGPQRPHRPGQRAAEGAQERRFADPGLAAHEDQPPVRAADDVREALRELLQMSRTLQKLGGIEPRSAAHAPHAVMIPGLRGRCKRAAHERQRGAGGRAMVELGRRLSDESGGQLASGRARRR